MILGRRLLLYVQRQVVLLQTILLLFFSFIIFTSQATAVIRFTDRSLFVNSPAPSAITDYTVSFTYTSQTTVGSVDLLFCNDPIPTDPCDPPAGLNVSNAVLDSQSGETGYTIALKTANHIVLTRSPSVVGNTPSVYKFTGITNPSDVSQSFAIRLSDYASTDATGSLIDLGSILSQINIGIGIETQVPPMLIFCVGKEVNDDCTSNTGGNYVDLGDITATNTLYTSSQMAAGTNASSGYVITANGTTMAAGSSVINALTTPTLSTPGNSQFGINLTANSAPNIGSVPDGSFTNAVVSNGYNTPNLFKFQSGDTVASAPNVSLIRRFTVSYVINAPPDLRAGVYTTTLTYICSGRF